MTKENNLNNYRKETIRLTIPVFLELLVSSLFGMIDMMMVGNSGPSHISTPSIAAIGITNQVILIGIAVAQAMGSAGTAIISRYYGANKTEKIPSVVKHLIIILIGILIIPFAMVTQLFPINIMEFIGADQSTIDIGSKYFIAMSFGFLFQSFNLSVFAAIRGEGDTRTPMIINIGSNIINVIGNYALIFGKFGFPALGITGAGIATAFSHIIASIASFIILLNKSRIVRLDLRKGFKFEKTTVENLFKIGGPAAIEQVAFRLGVVVFIRMITGLGTVVYATHQIASNIVSLSFAPGQAFGIAASTLVGRSLGEERLDRAETYVKESNRLSLITSLFFVFLFYFFGPKLTAIYTDDQSVIAESVNVMKIIALIQPFQSSAFAISGGLRGAGDTVWTLIITMFGVIVIRLSVAYVLINIVGLGLVGAWTAMLFDQVVRWIGITIRYRTGKWKEIELK
ncbi:MAG TPA: MATE family efflux transporter [Tissierellaceae bacterium]|nr:MATE family efflux transporter [Tissierellaceae bacterium]